MSHPFLSTLADEISEFEQLENQWPQDWSYDEVDERIDQHHDVIEKAEAKGLNRIGAGGFRVVFEILPNNELGLDPETVLKVSKYDGTRQNAEAVEIYQNLGPDVREYVAGITEASEDNRWLLQQKASNAKNGDTKAVIEGLAEHGYACSDIRRENCGRIQGQPVLVDLALLR